MKLKIKSTLLVAFLSLGVYAQEYSGQGKDISEILANIQAFSKAYVDADYEKLSQFYSEDAKIFPTGTDIISGRAAIKKRWTLPKHIQMLSHRVTPSEIKVLDDIAYDYGYYQGQSKNKKGEISSFKGKYVIVWKNEGKGWKIYLDIWNNIKDDAQ